ncbi:MAG: hypothetical protein WAW96_20910 [Alphaproteobacteria bacterium]
MIDFGPLCVFETEFLSGGIRRLDQSLTDEVTARLGREVVLP